MYWYRYLTVAGDGPLARNRRDGSGIQLSHYGAIAPGSRDEDNVAVTKWMIEWCDAGGPGDSSQVQVGLGDNVELTTFSTGLSHPDLLQNVMAPDRGTSSPRHSATRPEEERESISQDTISEDGISTAETEHSSLLDHRQQKQKFLAEQAQERNFTLRSVLVGLVIGVVICFSNTYFGLQTGWISGMSMPSVLIGFAWFKSVARWIDYPFTPVENVLVQTVSGAVGAMPLGCGFVGVMPALNYILTPEENGPLNLPMWKLIVWALGICFFGVVFAVPLRREVIIREKLKFPTGTATALVIGVLHGNPDGVGLTKVESGLQTFRRRSQDLVRSSTNPPTALSPGDGPQQIHSHDLPSSDTGEEVDHRGDWKTKIKLMVYAFALSAVYVRFPNRYHKLL